MSFPNLFVIFLSIVPVVATDAQAVRHRAEVWYALGHGVPVRSQPTLQGMIVMRIGQPEAVCVVRWDRTYAAVRIPTRNGGLVTGYVEKNRLLSSPVVGTTRVSLNAACDPKPVAVIAEELSLPMPSASAGDAVTPAAPQVDERARKRQLDDDEIFLRNELATLRYSQEGYLSDLGAYAADVAQLARYYVPSERAVIEISSASDQKWTATAKIRDSDSVTCEFTFDAAKKKNEPRCTKP